MTEKRPHAELAAKYFADSELKCWVWVKPVDENGFWEKVDMPKWSPSEIYEVGEFKPTHTPKRKVTLAGITFNAPESVAPEVNTRYWIPQPETVGAGACECRWTCSEFSRECLKNGFVHLKEEDAKLHAEALIKLSKELK